VPKKKSKNAKKPEVDGKPDEQCYCPGVHEDAQMDGQPENIIPRPYLLYVQRHKNIATEIINKLHTNISSN